MDFFDDVMHSSCSLPELRDASCQTLRLLIAQLLDALHPVQHQQQVRTWLRNMFDDALPQKFFGQELSSEGKEAWQRAYEAW